MNRLLFTSLVIVVLGLALLTGCKEMMYGDILDPFPNSEQMGLPETCGTDSGPKAMITTKRYVTQSPKDQVIAHYDEQISKKTGWTRKATSTGALWYNKDVDFKGDPDKVGAMDTNRYQSLLIAKDAATPGKALEVLETKQGIMINVVDLTPIK